MTKSFLARSPAGRACFRQKLLLGSALAALCAGSAPAVAQTYVGNDFSAGTSLLTALQSDGYKDNVAPFVILQEYNPAGPATSGAIFTSQGTVTDVSYYGGFTGGGKYDFTVYALALDSSNAAQNKQTFTVVGDQTFSGTVSFQGVHNLPADFSVGAGDYLAFAGIGPFYPQTPNDAVGSDATYESASLPNTFTAIPPTEGQTFTVGAHGDANATYDYGPNVSGNQGRSYGIGVTYTPYTPPKIYYLNPNVLGTNPSWSNQSGQSNWVTQTGAATTPPTPGGNVFINIRTSANASGPTVVNFDAATDPKINSLTINSNNSYTGGQLVELSQSANTLTSGSKSIGATGPAEHLQTGGVNNVTGALTIGGFGTYDQGGTLNASSITVNPGGLFLFDGGTTTFTSFTNYGSVGLGYNGSAEVIAGSGATSTFTQLSGGVNQASQLGIGNAANTSGVYSLQGGLLQVTYNESIGQNGFGEFIQSGNSTNSINGQTGTLNVSGANLRSVVSGAQPTPTSYLLQGGTLTAVYTEHIGGVNPSAPGPGYFLQTGGTNNAGYLNIQTNGTYILRSGALFNSGDLAVDGTVTQNGIYSVAQYGIFSMSGGTAVVNNNLDNSGEVTISGAGVTLVVDGSVNNSADLLIQNGATLDPALTTSSAGTFGGTGTIVGPVKVTGGGVVADNLHIAGAYTQTGGTITFDIDPNGKGGYLESDLLFDPGNSVSITGTKIVFDFLNGASPLAFFRSGAFNLDAFLQESDGSRFSSDFNVATVLAGDLFATNMRGFDIAGFAANGAVGLVQTSTVPEPSTWATLALGFGGLGFAGWRRGGNRRRAFG